MTDENQKSIPELITSIEKKDKRFRIAQTVFMFAVIVAVGLGGYFLATYQTKERIARENQTNAIIEKQSAKIDDLTNKLRCLGNFFSQPDRQNLVVKDLNTCFTQRVDDGQSIFLNPNPGPEQNSQNTSRDGENTNNTPAPDQTPPPDVGSGPADQPPREILGIPVCVPFTDVCVRR